MSADGGNPAAMAAPAGASRGAPAAELLVCATCRQAEAPPDLMDGDLRPGARLHAALREADLPEGLQLRLVECLSNCRRGCSVALRAPGKWTYVYGNLSPAADHVEAIRDGAARYLASADGLVPWRERPEHFRKNCIARIPPLDQEPTDV